MGPETLKLVDIVHSHVQWQRLLKNKTIKFLGVGHFHVSSGY
jgi:hypothetical protein